MDIYPQVTVVIPNYNHAKFLDKRIQSVLHQSYQDFELIILDDSSKDNSVEIIKKYNHPKIKVLVFNAENSGSVFKQWVKGIKLAKGKFLWIAESDDFADEQFLAEVIPILEDNCNLGFVFTDSFEIDISGRKIRKNSDRIEFLKFIKHYPYIFYDHEEAPKFFIETMLIQNASSVVFNLEKLKNVVDLERLKLYKNTGDRYTYLSIFLKYNLAYLNRPLNFMRLHGTNTTQRNTVSGYIYGERIRTVASFVNQISNFPISEHSLKIFLQKNFLPATDFAHFKEINFLLNKMYRFNFLSLKDFTFFKSYIYIAQITSKNPPNFLRKWVKKRLS